MTGSRGEAFEAFFGRVYPDAHRVASRLAGSPRLADEAVTDAFSRALLRWRRLRALPHRDAWVLRSTAETAMRATAADRAPARTASADTEDEVVRRALVDALRRLPREQRQVVVLRHLAGVSVADVAAVLGRPDATIEHLHEEALSTLRTLLDGARDDE